MKNQPQGWIKLHRKLKETSFYKRSIVIHLFLHLLLSANQKKNKFYWNGEEIEVDVGQLLTGRDELSKQTGISPQSIRTAMMVLKSTSTITIKSTNRFSLISILNWGKYQGSSTSKSTSNLTNNQPTTNQQLTTNNNIKNVENDKNINTYLSLFNKLFNKEHQPTKTRIEKLSLRLKAFSLQDVLDATVNLSRSAFHRGKNDRGWIADPDFLIRCDERIDKWRNNGSAPKQKQSDELLEFAKRHGNKIIEV